MPSPKGRDLLINNAGFGEYGDFADLDGERQVKMVQLNILVSGLTHQFLSGMRQRRSGGIINMSRLRRFNRCYFSVYAASKAFVLSFSEALWAERIAPDPCPSSLPWTRKQSFSKFPHC